MFGIAISPGATVTFWQNSNDFNSVHIVKCASS